MTDESKVRMIRRLNRLRWIAVSSFVIGIAIPVIAFNFLDVDSPRPSWRVAIVLVLSALLILFSPVVLIGSIVVRDQLAKEQGWRFSLRELLGWMTGIAIALGILAYLLRQ